MRKELLNLQISKVNIEVDTKNVNYTLMHFVYSVFWHSLEELKWWKKRT